MQVPSAYFLTDAFLMLDGFLGKKMIVPTETEGKVTLAGQEGVKLKKLLGALRNLWRSNKTNGQDDKITHLKSFLEESPSKKPDGEEETCGGLEVVPARNDLRPIDGNDPVSDAEEAASSCKGSQSESGDEGPLVRVGRNDGGEPSGSESSEAESAVSECNSPTLRLGESPKSDGKSVASVDSSSSSHRDSQVSSGWMGRAINHYTREEKEDQLVQLVNEIHIDLESQVMSKLEGKEWNSYSDYCLETLRRFGESCYRKLADLDFFKTWCRNRKAEDLQLQKFQ